jgi:peptidoglycan/LPS O-acetylase OafA/YrhL
MTSSITEHNAHSPVLIGAASSVLDALRALAANLVLLSHTVLIYTGSGREVGASVAVALFFLLSGFLITQSMLNWQNRPEPRLPAFLADRVARLGTPYVPALLLVAAANVLWVSTKWGAPGTNTGALSFAGNLFMLQDHSLFNILDLLRIDIPWRFRSYNTAEPLWTVAIELWIYVAAGLFFFCGLCRERIRLHWLWILAGLSFPVAVWNAAAGGGKSLSLIWLLGAVAACALARIPIRGPHGARWTVWLVLFGAAGLLGRIAKVGLDGFDLQTAALGALVLFGVLIGLARQRLATPRLERVCGFFASYSYSLYLIHNTVLVVVWETTRGSPRWLSILIGVSMAHLVAYGLYLAFERHHRRVSRWLRPHFERVLLPAPAVSPARPSQPTHAAGKPPPAVLPAAAQT